MDIDVEGTAVIRAGGITGWSVSSTNSIGVVGTVIDSCSAEGSICAKTSGASLLYVGGIAAHANISTAIINCWTDINVSGTSTGGNNSAYAGGIAGMTGNNVTIINCAAFGDSYANSPVSTNFGGMAGGISAMFAGKQWNTYAMGDATIGNQSSPHEWAGALHGEITTSGMTKSGSAYIYPETGALRDYSYYAGDITLTVEKWTNATTKASESTKELVATGTGTITHDTVFESSENVTSLSREYMQSQAFADLLNGNLTNVENLMASYQIADKLTLNRWSFVNGKVLPVTGSND